MFWRILVVVTILFNILLSAPAVVHLQKNEGSDFVPATTAKMDARLLESAIELEDVVRQGAQVPRIALCDIAFAKDSAENSKLAGYGVLMITTVAHNPDELPVKNVAICSKNKTYNLKKIKTFSSMIKNSRIRAVLGSNRSDSYYLIPYSLTKKEGNIILDFNKNRKAFQLYKLPAETTLSFKDFSKAIADSSKIDEIAFNNFLQREFGITR
jgi:hypothetical protein